MNFLLIITFFVEPYLLERLLFISELLNKDLFRIWLNITVTWLPGRNFTFIFFLFYSVTLLPCPRSQWRYKFLSFIYSLIDYYKLFYSTLLFNLLALLSIIWCPILWWSFHSGFLLISPPLFSHENFPCKSNNWS